MLDGKKEVDTLDVIFKDTFVSCARELLLWFKDTFLFAAVDLQFQISGTHNY
jgi:hypothetical protein